MAPEGGGPPRGGPSRGGVPPNLYLNRQKKGSKGAKKGQKGPKRAKKGFTDQIGPKGQMGPNEAKWDHMGLIFCMQAYFYEIRKSCLATQALRQKLA